MFRNLFGSGKEESADEKKSYRSEAMKRILFFSLLAFLILWGIYNNKFDLRFAASSPYGMQASETRALPEGGRQVDVHPEVLNLQESFARVAEIVKPAVVNISTVHLEKYAENPYEFYFMDPDELFEQFFNMHPRSKKSPQRKYREQKVPGTGSGVLIDPDGYILTNEHVVQGADEIKVTLAETPDKKYDGKVIGRDERTDLAIIRIKASKKLPYAKLGDSSVVRVGEWAIAIGSPFSLEQTVTVGIISASRQNFSIQGRNYKDLIQTDAAINLGNSGGPLLNIYGEVIGINTAIYTPSGGFAGIGFAIPINRAKEIIPQLREKGKVVRGWIGVVLEPKIDDATASVYGVPDKEGAMVKDVLKNFPAAKAGLKRGDIIREFAGKKVKDNFDLQSVVSSVLPDRTVQVKIIRNRREMVLEIVTSEAPASLESLEKEKDEKGASDGKKEAGEEVAWLGAAVKELTASLRERFSVPEPGKGVIVVDVKEGSKAEEMGLMGGDLICVINQEEVADLKSFNQIIKKVRTKEGIVLDILRRGEPLYLKYIGPEK